MVLVEQGSRFSKFSLCYMLSVGVGFLVLLSLRVCLWIRGLRKRIENPKFLVKRFEDVS